MTVKRSAVDSERSPRRCSCGMQRQTAVDRQLGVPTIATIQILARAASNKTPENVRAWIGTARRRVLVALKTMRSSVSAWSPTQAKSCCTTYRRIRGRRRRAARASRLSRPAPRAWRDPPQARKHRDGTPTCSFQRLDQTALRREIGARSAYRTGEIPGTDGAA